MNPTTPPSLQAFSANAVKAGLHKLIEKMRDTGSPVQIQILQNQLLSLCLQDQADNDQAPRRSRFDGDEQDLHKTGGHKYSTVIKALDYMREEQYQSLETFYEHLTANYFPTVKLSKIKGSKWTSLVTHPAPALIHFYYNVSPAYIIVQDLTQCGESKAMMIMKTLEDIMSKFDLSLKLVNRRSTSKKKKNSKRAVEKSQKSNKSVLWETKTNLMLPDNEAASTMRKVEDRKLYPTLVAYFKSSDQGTSSSEEHSARRLDGTSSSDQNIPSLDRIHEVKSGQGTSSSAEHDIPSLDRIHEITSDQGSSSSAEQDIPSLDQIHEVTSDQGTLSSAEQDIPSLDQIHEVKSDQGTLSPAEQDIPSLDQIHEVKSDQGTSSSAEQDIPSLDQIHEVKSDQGTLSSAEQDIPSLDQIHGVKSDQGTLSSAEQDILSLDQIHEVKSDQGTLSSAEQDISSLDQIHEVKSDQGTLSSAEQDIPSLDQIHEVKSDQGTSSSAEQDIPSLDQIHEVKSDQGTLSSAEHDIQSLDKILAVKSDRGTSSSGEHSARLLDGTSSREHDIPSLDGRKHETKLPLPSKRTKDVEEMECEIMQLKETVRSLEEKFDESRRKLRAKEMIEVKSTGSQTSKKQEEELQLKMNDLEQTVSRLEEELRRSKEKTVKAEKSFKSIETRYKQQLLYVRKKNEDLNDKASALERKLQNKEEEINVTLADFGRALVERDTLVREMKARRTTRSSPVEVTSSSSQTSEMPPSPEAPTRIRGAEAVTERGEHLTANSEATEENSESNGAAVAVHESQAEANRRDTISLANIPTTTVERGLYFNYKLMLLLIPHRLLSGDVIKFKEWATSILAVDVTASVDDVFLELDRRGVISAVNLEKLREFFEKILRFDLVHMIDCFIVGDYPCLRNTGEGTPRRNNPGSTPRVNDPSQRATASSRSSLQSSVLTSGRHRQSSLRSQARTSEVEESYVPPRTRRPDTSAVAPSPRVIDRSQRATARSRTSLQSSVLTSGRHRQSSLRSQARTSEVEESYVPPRTRRPDTSAVAHSNRRAEVSGGTVYQPMRGDAPGAIFGIYIPETIDSNFEFIREDVPGITEYLL